LTTKTKSIFWETIFEIAALKEKIRRLDAEISQDSFWQNNQKSQEILSNLSKLKNQLNDYEQLVQLVDEAVCFAELVEEEGKEDEHTTELSDYVHKIAELVDAQELKALLSGPYDAGNCILSLNAGAGGTDAQDWAQMLLRMYTRWLEKKRYNYEIVDFNYGEEAGLKSATIVVQGSFAYGHLKAEDGVHRLVRISPFNANSKRQTSFAALEVLPELEFEGANLELDPKDLKIDTFRAQGAGGQHINKTDSAVRITHLPTGLVAQSQNDRSQGANKEMALKILKARLLQLLQEEHKDKINDLKAKNKDIAWGNQIRSYVFHPYKLVKDLRTEVETSDVTKVMDGEIDMFIQAFLRLKKKI
jgi:peptide chain release factor 2